MTNVAAALALFSSITDDDLASGAIHFAEDAEWVEIPLGKTYRGPDGWYENVNYWKTAFSDGHVEVTNVIDGGDQVVIEYTGGGTNTGVLVTPHGSIDPNGKHIVARFVDVWEFREGKILGGRSYVSDLMAQLGRPEVKG
jgi:ketosteroid isomerase-like protein